MAGRRADREGSIRRRLSSLDGDRAQAQIEFVAAIPAVLILAVIVLQLFAVGYSQSLVDGAAEAGAIAVSEGTDVEPAVAAALPGWASRRIEVSGSDGEVEVVLRTPALIPPLARRLEVSSSAYSRPDGSSG